MNKFIIASVFSVCLCVFAAAQDAPTKPADNSGDAKTSQAAGDGKPLRLLSKPSARYTDAAKRNNQEGSVTLKVEFLASGEIGEVFVVKGLPFGLTEQAVAAAKQIKFEPAKKNGQPLTTLKTVVYSFVVPYSEDEKEIKKRAVILEKPTAEYPAGENFKKLRGFVRLEVSLTSFGEITAMVIASNLPKEFESKALAAARKIKFEPAQIKNEVKVSVLREIEYEFIPEN
jgi:TonB family protein